MILWFLFIIIILQVTMRRSIVVMVYNKQCTKNKSFKTWRSSTHVQSAHFGTSAFNFTDESQLKTMTLVQLKEILKAFGGKTSNMKKSELIESCLKISYARKINESNSLKTSFDSDITNLDDCKNYSKSNVIKKLQAIPSNFMHSDSVSSSVQEALSIDSSQHQSNRHDKKVFSINAKFPVGPNRTDRFQSMASCDMDITFLGTASCIPSISRGVSSIAFRCRSQVWLFDCGESTQLQLQKSQVKPSKISKIFLTHLHGDHSFGLPGVLCMLGQSTQDERGKAKENGDALEPIEIYGPEGTRDYVRATMALTYSRVAVPHRIHELKNVPFLHGRFMSSANVRGRSNVDHIRTQFTGLYGEKEGGRNIFPNEDGIYNVFEDDDVEVYAGPMQHTVPCVGFIIKEKDRIGKLNMDIAQPLVEKNKNALNQVMRDYKKTYSKLKALKSSDIFTFPDGTQITAKDILDPSREGRKVVICGDTCNSDMIANISQGADLIVHESTNAWDSLSASRFQTYHEFEHDTFIHGHSTPQVAGRFAKKIGAKKLVLSHFSPRYRGDDFEHNMKTMWQLEDMARIGSSYLFGDNDVIAAWDQLCLPIEQRDSFVGLD